jgi:hypothetical protein
MFCHFEPHYCPYLYARVGPFCVHCCRTAYS